MSGLWINGSRYEVDGVVGKVQLGDILDLQVATKGPLKVTPKTINTALAQIPDLLTLEGEFSFDLFDESEDLTANIIGLVFLTRRAAQELISYEDARRTDFATLRFEFDEEEPAPKGGAASAALKHLISKVWKTLKRMFTPGLV